MGVACPYCILDIHQHLLILKDYNRISERGVATKWAWFVKGCVTYSVNPPVVLVSVTSCNTSTHMSRSDPNRPITQLHTKRHAHYYNCVGGVSLATPITHMSSTVRRDAAARPNSFRGRISPILSSYMYTCFKIIIILVH